jgi:phospholipid/cholesterol/gamma-HCH transport system substrate-binding protein
MTDQLKNILIGLFVAIAITIGISMILFLEPSVGDGKQLIQVRFANVSGINVGTRVTFGGKVVGEVSSIKQVPNARELAIDETGKVYLYQLVLKCDSSVKILSSDEVTIRTTGLMGERSVAIIPKLASHGTTAVPITHQILYANAIDPMENTINQVGKVATSVQAAVNRFDHWFSANMQDLTNSVHMLSTNLQDFHDQKILEKTSSFVSSLNSTEGTIGKIVNTDDLYLRFSSILGKVETMMHDINHYGLLFQYQKPWQRQRTKRASAIAALQSPSDFKNYYETEISGIQASLGRLTELLQRAADESERDRLVKSDTFKRDFGSLLRQVEALSDTIKLYNEEMVSGSEN